MKQITVKQYVKIHLNLPVQRGNVRISNLNFINALPYVLENGSKLHAGTKQSGSRSSPGSAALSSGGSSSDSRATGACACGLIG